MLAACTLLLAQAPHPILGGYSLPNGWQITPVGRAIATEDLILNLTASKDNRIVVAQHGGFKPHGLLVIDSASEEAVQRIGLHSSWLGLAWSNDGSKLYVSGGNASGPKHTSDIAPIYTFGYSNGRLTEKPLSEWRDTLRPELVYWTGLAMHPKRISSMRPIAGYPLPGHVSVFNTDTGKIVQNINVDISPYDLQFNDSGTLLYVSNWGSGSISVVDTAAGKTIATMPTGGNPNDMELGYGRWLYVSERQREYRDSSRHEETSGNRDHQRRPDRESAAGLDTERTGARSKEQQNALRRECRQQLHRE